MNKIVILVGFMLLLLVVTISIFCTSKSKVTDEQYTKQTELDTSDLHKSVEYKNKQDSKGIVFFDIDDTLSNMEMSEKDNIINHCINKGYKIGIITASLRTPSHVCNGKHADTEISPWASDSLCKQLHKDEFKLFNSLIYTAGSENFEFPGNIKDQFFYGRQKGWQMIQTCQKNNIDISKSFLFDDNPDVLKGANMVNKDGVFVLVDNNSHNKKLPDLVYSLIF